MNFQDIVELGSNLLIHNIKIKNQKKCRYFDENIKCKEHVFKNTDYCKTHYVFLLQQLSKKRNEKDYCIVCDEKICSPLVKLNCEHQIHLNCFLLSNTINNKFDFKNKCFKCNDKILKSSSDIIKCSICLEDIFENEFKTKCNHSFHTRCLSKWLKNANNCPNCRTNFD
jgi:hypothetical protein